MCYGDNAYIGSTRDFRIFKISKGQKRQQIDVGVKGMFSKKNLLLVALSDNRVILINMKTNTPVGLLGVHSSWISSIGIFKNIGLYLFEFVWFLLSSE
jgi:hypothetical protein